MEIATVLTRESLEKLLLCLDGDPERAGEKYETLRLGLVRFFEWRGCAFPEDHTDETIDRVAKKLIQGEEIRDIYKYSAGVARFVYLETVKEWEQQEAALRERPAAPIADSTAAEEAHLECLRRCLRALPTESSQLILAYYQDMGSTKIAARKRLAQQLGVSQHTLRMRLQRLRAKIEECVVGCVQSQSGRNRPPGML
jgi:DNA-directed RNA polymerase specialized sigma24 family protein